MNYNVKNSKLEVSIVIPVYNEEKILCASLTELRNKLQDIDFTYEIIIVENGSTDKTLESAMKYSELWSKLKTFSIDEPNYGKALREGIFRACGQYIICDEIDMCNVDFYHAAINHLRNGYELVVGSKRALGAKDQRPFYRRLMTQIFNVILRIAIGFTGTDTHGLKAFRRKALLNIIESCVVDKDLFASEFVIRAHRANHKWIEEPVDTVEKRTSSIKFIRRVPNALKNIIKLTMIIRLGWRLKY